jgi:hypothetical protein
VSPGRGSDSGGVTPRWDAGGGVSPRGGWDAGGGVSPRGGRDAGGGVSPRGGSDAGGGVSPRGGSDAGGGVSPRGGSDAGGGVSPRGGSNVGGGVTPRWDVDGSVRPRGSWGAGGGVTGRGGGGGVGLSRFSSWAMTDTSLGVFQPDMPSFQTCTALPESSATMRLAASVREKGPLWAPATATYHSTRPPKGSCATAGGGGGGVTIRSFWLSTLAPDAALLELPAVAFAPAALAPSGGMGGSEADLAEGVAFSPELAWPGGGSFGPEDADLRWGVDSPGAASESAGLSWTRITLPQVLQRMRRIFCLTFSSAME